MTPQDNLRHAFRTLADAYDRADWSHGDESGTLLTAENLLAHLRQAIGDGIPEGPILNHYVRLVTSVTAKIRTLPQYETL